MLEICALVKRMKTRWMSRKRGSAMIIFCGAGPRHTLDTLAPLFATASFVLTVRGQPLAVERTGARVKKST
jgi:hypothetical protein